jgi:hypothetical protein
MDWHASGLRFVNRCNFELSTGSSRWTQLILFRVAPGFLTGSGNPPDRPNVMCTSPASRALFLAAHRSLGQPTNANHEPRTLSRVPTRKPAVVCGSPSVRATLDVTPPRPQFAVAQSPSARDSSRWRHRHRTYMGKPTLKGKKRSMLCESSNSEPAKRQAPGNRNRGTRLETVTEWAGLLTIRHSLGAV